MHIAFQNWATQMHEGFEKRDKTNFLWYIKFHPDVALGIIEYNLPRWLVQATQETKTVFTGFENGWATELFEHFKTHFAKEMEPVVIGDFNPDPACCC